MLKIIKQLLNTKEMLNSIDTDNELIEVDEDLRTKLQNTILEMFLDIYGVCKKHDLQVALIGGSALGAIRHRGFIPWDDDLDIGMLRADYDKFTRVFESELSSKYTLCAPNYTGEAKTRFPKILKKDTCLQEIIDSQNTDLQKVFLDIFILENTPDNLLHRKIKGIYCNILEFISGVVFFYENSDELSKKVYSKAGAGNYQARMLLGRVFSFYNASKWNDIVDKAAQYKKESMNITIATGRKHYFGEILSKSELFPLTEGKFEGYTVPLFKNNDYYLTNLYGNYMWIPPIEKREKHFIRRIEL